MALLAEKDQVSTILKLLRIQVPKSTILSKPLLGKIIKRWQFYVKITVYDKGVASTIKILELDLITLANLKTIANRKFLVTELEKALEIVSILQAA